jgi:hypothetical protein
MGLVKTLGGLLLASSAVVLTGCQGGGPPALDRADLVSDLALRVDHSTTLDYLAEYQVSGGAVVSVTQSSTPRRTAYRYPGGALIITPNGTTTCGGRPTACSTVALSGSNAEPTGLSDLPKHGLVPAKLVSSLLTTAALDLSANYQQYESTIAGQPATCVEVTNLASPVTDSFEACVTTEGVVASFSGIVKDVAIELALARYSREVPESAFATASPKPSPAASPTTASPVPTRSPVVLDFTEPSIAPSNRG